MAVTRRLRRVRRDEAGQMAGIETVPFGVLVFIVGVLLVANAWGVIDAKLAVSSAAREATRAYVESRTDLDPMAQADAAAREAVRGAGRDPDRLQLTPIEVDFSRCSTVRFEASYDVPAIQIPLIGAFGHGFTATARHTEIVDPYRSGIPRGGTRCDTAP
ncbi:MAG: hypothetical protein ACRD12_11700 [Acidimicrobiales bacterium]